MDKVFKEAEIKSNLELPYTLICIKEGSTQLTRVALPERSNLTFTFDKKGHVQVNGRFMNKDTQYSSGILFDVSMDAFYNITHMINALKYFFEELKRIQGHSNFY